MRVTGDCRRDKRRKGGEQRKKYGSMKTIKKKIEQCSYMEDLTRKLSVSSMTASQSDLAPELQSECQGPVLELHLGSETEDRVSPGISRVLCKSSERYANSQDHDGAK